MVKFSIVLPVHNGGEHIKQCVANIIDQTFPDFNLIILENFSTDGTRQWLETLSDTRISILPSDRLLSIEENWKRILDIRKAEFMTLIAHDDLYDIHYLQVMNELIAEYPDASLFQPNFDYIDEDGKYLHRCKPMSPKEDICQLMEGYLTNKIDLMATGFMMRSSDYDLIGGMPVEYPNLLFADVALAFSLTRISYKTTAPGIYFHYRVHQSTTKNTPDQKLHLAFIKIIDFINELKKREAGVQEIVEKFGVAFIHSQSVSLAHRVLRSPKKVRGSMSVDSVVIVAKELAYKLNPDARYQPLKDIRMLVAKIIDSNTLFAKLFLLFKQVRPAPVLK